MEMWIDVFAKITITLLVAVVTYYVVPWLKKKGLYAIVKNAVNAAEKLAEKNEINKKQWVVDRLTAIGVKVTPLVDMFIESAVEELDIVTGKKNDGGAS